MSIKSILTALGVIASVQLFGGQLAMAESATATNAKPDQTVKVQPGDTLSSIAESHDTTYVRLFNANETITNPDVININDEIRIPKSDEELKDRYAEFIASQVTAPVAAPATPAQPTASYYRPAATILPVAKAPSYNVSSAGNTYAYGWCTWYVKSRKPSLPNNLGHAGAWVGNAAAHGYATGSTPVPGAIGAAGNHVVYVESVNGNMVTISEMAYAGGVGVQNFRTVPASSFYYIYA